MPSGMGGQYNLYIVLLLRQSTSIRPRADCKQRVQTPSTTRSPRRSPPANSTRRTWPSRPSSRPVCTLSILVPLSISTLFDYSRPSASLAHTPHTTTHESLWRYTDNFPDKKAREEMAKKAGGKGPMNTGQQGIKKSGKK